MIGDRGVVESCGIVACPGGTYGRDELLPIRAYPRTDFPDEQELIPTVLFNPCHSFEDRHVSGAGIGCPTARTR